MCHLNCCGNVSADESLLVYCKPVELYNILHTRSKENPTFLRRCLRYGRKQSRKRRLMAGTVIFNYRDYNNMLQKTEVTEDFSCPFCLIQCISFKGLRYHLCSSHDLFDFEFWVTEEYQAVNVSVKFDRFRCETVADGIEQRRQTFFFCSRLRRHKARKHDEVDKQACVQFLELDSPKVAPEVTSNGFWMKDDGENACKSSSSEKDLTNCRLGTENCGPGCPNASDLIERVASSSNIPGVSIAMAQSCVDPECVKSQCGSDHSVPVVQHVAKSRKLNVDRSDSRNRMLLQKRQFYHSHRVQPMALGQVMSDRDSEDEVDDDIADFEDRRMLDDFVDVSKDEKQLMHLWNSFVRKQRVLADGHVPWACEAFSKLHGHELVASPTLFCMQGRDGEIKSLSLNELRIRVLHEKNEVLEAIHDQTLEPWFGGCKYDEQL